MMGDILDALRGGDRRSIGRADEIVLEIEQKPDLFGEVFEGLYDDSNPVVRMRAADVVEKVTQSNPELLDGYTSRVIAILASVDQQEVCWHLAQIAPRLIYDENEESQLMILLKELLKHKSRIVRASAMDALAAFAERNHTMVPEVIDIIRLQMDKGSQAVQARGKKLLKRLGKR